MAYRQAEYDEYFDKYQKAQPDEYLNSPPFVYDLAKYIGNKNKLIFSSHGCAGEKGSSTSDIARSIHMDKSIKFNLLLGDNVYAGGIQRPRMTFWRNEKELIHNVIKEYYYDLYGKILSFCALGNHDYNYWGMQNNLILGDREKGPHIAIKQVEETYNYPKNCWQMPYRYYALSHQQTNTIIFVLDSNTFAWDELQQWWIDDVYNHYINFKNKILVMHHPAISFGKRAEVEHLKIYSPKNNIPQDENPFKPFKDAHTPIGNLIMNTLGGKRFDVLFCAHDHFFDVRQLKRHSGNTIQCTIGSAGHDRFKMKPWKMDEPNESFVRQRFPGIENMYLDENEILKQQNGYVKCVIDMNQGIFLQFINAKTGTPLFYFQTSEEDRSVEERLFILLEIPGTVAQPFFKEENRLLNLYHIIIGVKILFSNINLDIRVKRNNLLIIRDLLIRTYLAKKNPSFSQYQTNIYGHTQSCRKTWWAIDVIIASYYLKLILKLNEAERIARLSVIDKRYPFITMPRLRVSQRENNKTFSEFKRLHRIHSQEAEEILDAKISDTKEKVGL